MMKRFFLLAGFLLILFPAGAQITAITENGKAVILFSNGTWRYLHDSVKVSTSEIPHYFTPKNSGTSLSDKESRYAIWFNAQKWKSLPDTVYSKADFSLECHNGDLIAMIITEKLQVSLQKIKEATVESFKNTGTDYRITEEQKIMVNGTEGLLLKIDALVDGIPFSYLNGYFSTGMGTFQVITYTGYNLFDRYRNDMMDLISGFAAVNHE